MPASEKIASHHLEVSRRPGHELFWIGSLLPVLSIVLPVYLRDGRNDAAKPSTAPPLNEVSTPQLVSFNLWFVM